MEESSKILSQVSLKTDSISSLAPCGIRKISSVEGTERCGVDLEQGLQSFFCSLLFKFTFFLRTEISVSFCGLDLVENCFQFNRGPHG